MPKPKYVYKSRSKEEVKNASVGNQSKWFAYIKEGFHIWTPTRDVHRIRVLPPTYENPTSFGIRCKVHADVGPDEVTFLDLTEKDQADPVEERLAEARRQGRGDESWVWKQKAKGKAPTWIIDRDEEEKGPQLWPMADKTDQNLNACAIDRRTGAVLEIDNPDDGYDIEVDSVKEVNRKSGKEYTVYEFTVDGRKSYLSEDQAEQDEWMQFVIANPLDTVLVYAEYDTIVEAMGEVSHRRDTGEDRSASRSERRGGSRSRREEPRTRSRREESYDDGPVNDLPEGDGLGDWADERDDEEKEPEPEPRARRRSLSEPEPRARRRSRSEPEPEQQTRRRSRSEPEPEQQPRRRSRSEPEPEQQTRRRSRSEPEPEQQPRRRRVSQAQEPDLADDVGDNGLDDGPSESPRRRSR